MGAEGVEAGIVTKDEAAEIVDAELSSDSLGGAPRVTKDAVLGDGIALRAGLGLNLLL